MHANNEGFAAWMSVVSGNSFNSPNAEDMMYKKNTDEITGIKNLAASRTEK
jgi:hypothetical protein